MRVHHGVIDGIIAEARRAAPNECCGVLLARDREILWFEPVRNLSDDSSRFDADPLGLLRVEQDAARKSRTIIGYYHSHPLGDPRPSSTDRAGRIWPELPPYLHLIVSPDGQWVMYNMRDDAWTPVEVELFDAGPTAVQK